MPIRPTPGACVACGNSGGGTPPTPVPGRDIEHDILCDFDANGDIVGSAIAVYTYNDETGAVVGPPTLVVPGTNTPYVVQGTLRPCTNEAADFPDREGICYTLTASGTTVLTGWARHDDNIPNSPQTPNGIAFFDNLGNFIDPTVGGFTQVVCENPAGPSTPAFADDEYLVLCDDAGSFLRRYRYLQDSAGNVLTSTSNFLLDGSTPYAPVGTVRVCATVTPARTYTDTVQDITGAPFNVVPGANLVSVTIRNRNATTATFQVNGGAVLPMDTGEQWSSDVTDVNGTLTDTVVINPGNGTVRLTVQRRF